ncbi:sensor histidine kinase [Qipengyuania qiaonensis]|uniref:histidine kinase n=1 Tax=Qipengyuania qiaonensis TaxID=2867240 RepID=A0ABS7J8T8_9SPHN|nr:ATP-binding protein [Qipengyuania qiaonensis]MBX7481407.1 two-component sensor histidine kinase [Qipengyuania qiaonensis]
MSERRFPWSGFVLALVACTILAALDVDLIYVGSVLIVWIGSLYLVAARPPQAKVAPAGPAFTRDNMADLFEQSETPVVITERDRVVIANLSARTLLGGHIVGQDVRMALRQPEAVRLLERDAEGGAVVRGLTRRTDIWKINRKTLPGDLAVIEFVNKTAEADISRAHTDFVANASHELRTPLASIIGYVETLREDVENLDPPMADKFLGTIQREARRLQELVSDLMSLSRIEAEKHDLPSDTVEFARLAERAANDAAGGERSDLIDFEAADEFAVRGDQQQLEQLVRNLVDNGFKYGAPGQQVTVRLHPKGENRVRLTVTDRGEGIAAEHIPHLTRRFYRTDPGRSRASGGTGLGLAIVKHIVERHRGRLDIDSTLGEGTRVTVTLPIEKSSEIA